MSESISVMNGTQSVLDMGWRRQGLGSTSSSFGHTAFPHSPIEIVVTDDGPNVSSEIFANLALDARGKTVTGFASISTRPSPEDLEGGVLSGSLASIGLATVMSTAIGHDWITARTEGAVWRSRDLSVRLPETSPSGAYAIYTHRGVIFDQDTESVFRSLVSKWNSERSDAVSGTEIFLHQAYQQIIGLGTKVVPLILRQLDRELDHWFWALAAITRQNPVPQTSIGNMIAMREAWMRWGRRSGYRW